MAERARSVQEKFEQRQQNTGELLQELFAELQRNEQRQKEQAEKGFDGLTWYVYQSLKAQGLDDADATSLKIRKAFVDFPTWRVSEQAQRELRRKVTFALYAQLDDPDRVAALVDELFTLLSRTA